MQRRSFLQSSTSLAALALPAVGMARTAAHASDPSALAISLVSKPANPGVAPAISDARTRGTIRLRVADISARPDADVRFRLWFAGDEGQHAFELASHSPARGRSSSLRLQAETERLLAVDAEVAGNNPQSCGASAQCLLTQGGLGRLQPGTHWILLHDPSLVVQAESDPAVIAGIRLDIESA